MPFPFKRNSVKNGPLDPPQTANPSIFRPDIESEIESLKQVVVVELKEEAAAAAIVEAKALGEAAAAALRASEKASADASLAIKQLIQKWSIL